MHREKCSMESYTLRALRKRSLLKVITFCRVLYGDFLGCYGEGSVFFWSGLRDYYLSLYYWMYISECFE